MKGLIYKKSVFLRFGKNKSNVMTDKKIYILIPLLITYTILKTKNLRT